MHDASRVSAANSQLWGVSRLMCRVSSRVDVEEESVSGAGSSISSIIWRGTFNCRHCTATSKGKGRVKACN